MKCYLKWYYWYKNFGDELLLLWVLTYLVQEMKVTACVIETPNPQWLEERLMRHTQYFPLLTISYASTIYQTIKAQIACDIITIWWGEVITDARRIPHNGWNYLLRNYWTKILWKKILLLGWFWKPIHKWSKLLYSLLYQWAHRIVCREYASYERVIQYVSKSKVILHEDFSYMILRQITPSTKKENYAIVNCNPYIRSEKTKKKIIGYGTNWWFHKLVYLPAEVSVDTPIYDSLTWSLSSMEWFDRTQNSLQSICNVVANSSWWIAARLHVLILLKYFEVSYQPLVYQEKITKILWHE